MIKIGVIGSGYWGPNIVRNFRALTDCRVKTVADLVPGNLLKLKELFPDIKTTENYKEILEDSEIGAVAIVTQAITHYRLIKEALLAEKHVFVEKPLTMNSSEGEELVSLAQRQKKILMVGHVFEYNQAVAKIRKMLTERELGKIFFIYSQRASLGPIRSDASVVWDFAFHDLCILTHVLRKNPSEISAWGKSFLRKGIEDFGFINLEFPGRISASIRVGWLYPVKERGMIIIGEKKMLVYDDLNKEKPLSVYDYEPTTWKISNVSYPEVEAGEPLYLECRHFIDCIKQNKVPLTDGKRGVKIVKIIEAAQRSLNSGGKKISVPE